MLGNNLGTTGIALFDENKQLVGTVDIEVTLDTDRLAEHDPRQRARRQTSRSARPTAGWCCPARPTTRLRPTRPPRSPRSFSGEEEVINSVNISSSQQVQLNVRFVEINRQVGQELGAKIGASYSAAGGGDLVQFRTRRPRPTAPAGEIIGALLTNGCSIDVAIKALEDRGVARRLAEPNLIARSGQKASFLAGGEFPIPVSEDNGQITVEYKKYGVSLDFTPTVLTDGLISLDIEPEVSSIDSLGVLSGRQHLHSRLRGAARPDLGRPQERPELHDRRPAAERRTTSITQRIPGLGKLPVLGALFSSKAYQRRETDLVIIVTPYLVKPIDPSKKLQRRPTGRCRPAASITSSATSRRSRLGRPRQALVATRRAGRAARARPFPRPAEG